MSKGAACEILHAPAIVLHTYHNMLESRWRFDRARGLGDLFPGGRGDAVWEFKSGDCGDVRRVWTSESNQNSDWRSPGATNPRSSALHAFLKFS